MSMVRATWFAAGSIRYTLEARWAATQICLPSETMPNGATPWSRGISAITPAGSGVTAGVCEADAAVDAQPATACEAPGRPPPRRRSRRADDLAPMGADPHAPSAAARTGPAQSRPVALSRRSVQGHPRSGTGLPPLHQRTSRVPQGHRVCCPSPVACANHPVNAGNRIDGRGSSRGHGAAAQPARLPHPRPGRRARRSWQHPARESPPARVAGRPGAPREPGAVGRSAGHRPVGRAAVERSEDGPDPRVAAARRDWRRPRAPRRW